MKSHRLILPISFFFIKIALAFPPPLPFNRNFSMVLALVNKTWIQFFDRNCVKHMSESTSLECWSSNSRTFIWSCLISSVLYNFQHTSLMFHFLNHCKRYCIFNSGVYTFVTSLDSPRLTVVWLTFLTPQWCESDKHSVNHSSGLRFWLFPGLVICWRARCYYAAQQWLASCSSQWVTWSWVFITSIHQCTVLPSHNVW